MSGLVESTENQSPNTHFDLKGILTSFGHAASCFANAATALSSAAQALATAADALSKASNTLEYFDLGLVADSGSLANLLPSKSPAPDDSGQNPTLVISSQSVSANEGDPDKQPQGEEPDADNDCDYFAEEDEDYIQALIRRQLEENMLRDNSVDSRLESPATLSHSPPDILLTGEEDVAPRVPDIPISEMLKQEPPFQRSLLVASEADVLPVACIFAQSYDKVLCYLDCPLPCIMLFQKIIKGVTGTSVYTATRGSASELNSLCRAFNKQTKAILLLHETVHSDLTITATYELCVIHVGWPCDADRYSAQISFQNAPYSALVAYNEHQNIYPSCAKVLDCASPWPENERPVFEREVIKLRPKFEDVLDGIPVDIKTKFYSEWIELHGPRGQRHVSSWSPTALVARANVYLRDVLKYPAQEIGLAGSGAPRRTFPPAVSMEFVTANNLEAALASGILKVVQEDSKPNNLANKFGVANPETGSRQSDDSEASKTSGPVTNVHLVDTNGAASDPTQVGTSHPHVDQPEPLRLRCLLAAEGDVLPLACSLVRDFDRVVCYVAYCDSMLDLFVQMLREATSGDYVIINGLSDVEGATALVPQFSANQREVLVLPNYSLTAGHSTGPGCVLHVGWPIDHRTYLAQLAQYKSDVSILVAYEQDIDMSDQCAETVAYTLPYGDRLDLNTNRLSGSLLAVKLVLGKTELKAKARIYSDWIHDHGPQGRRPVKNWPPVTAARRAEDFLYNVLEYPTLTPVGVARIAGTQSPEPQDISEAALAPTHASDEPLRDPVKIFTNVRSPPKLQSDGDDTAVNAHTLEQGDPLDFSENCLVIEDEFDFIPAICLCAKNPAVRNTICYVKVVGTMQTLAAQQLNKIQAMISKPVLVVATDVSGVIPRVLQAFESSIGSLVFCNALAPPIKRLRGQTVQQVIHAGWIGDGPHYEQQTDCTGLLRKRLILTQSEYALLRQHPLRSSIVRSSVFDSDPSSKFTLAPTRANWKHQLKVAPQKALNGCYMEWMLYHGAGPYKVKHLPGIDLVEHANTFAKTTLLRGSDFPDDKSLLGGRLAVTEGFARYLKLMPAVQAKLLQIGSG